MHIRSAQPNDLDAVWHMWKAIMDQKVYYPYDESYTRKDIEAAWINLENDVFVAETAVGIAGAYILRPNQPGYGNHIANAAYMVDTTQRGAGIGQALCAHSIQAARNLGYRGMQFNMVVSTNEGAVRAWEKNGFRIIGTVPGAFRHVEQGYVDAHIMFREL